MRSCVPLFVATLASIAAGPAGSSEPRGIALGESFELEAGGSAQIAEEALIIGFQNVSADSRCPKGERCIWEGDATVRIRLQKAPGPKETRELHSSPKDEGAVSYLGYEVKLLRLDPYPVSGRAIAQGDYLVTLEVTRGPSSPPDSP